MSIEAVRAYLKPFGRASDILEFNESSATVELAAKAVGVIPARIAKTLSFHAPNGGCLLIVAAGDTKIDNFKFKKQFHCKAKMLTPEETLQFTGHAVGGVCPFGLPKEDTAVYLDISLKRFQTVYPAAGSSNSAICLTCDELEALTGGAEWIDVCKLPVEQAGAATATLQ